MHTPYIIERNEGYERAYDIYSKLLTDRIIFLEGEITDLTANTIVSELLYLDSISNDDIYIYINSPGGSITSGFAIYDTINYIKSNVITIGIGMCASMAAFILSSGNTRCALKNTEIMIHQPLGGAQGQASDVAIHAEHILKTKKKLTKILSDKSGQPIEVIEKDTDRDNFMSANEALKYGLIDKIFDKR